MNTDHTPFQKSPFDVGTTTTRIPMSHVYMHNQCEHLNPHYLFMAHFNQIPHVIEHQKIHAKKATDWLMKTYAQEVKDYYFHKTFDGKPTRPDPDQLYFFLFEDLLVHINAEEHIAWFLYKQTPKEKVDEVRRGVAVCKYRPQYSKPKISLLVNGYHGIETRMLEINKPQLSIADNYNDDFPEVHQTIFKRLSTMNDKGLVLLHGKPGTGKTSYIRYLISTVKKQVIFLPPNMAQAITDPNLISILIDNPNSIFVIEDAENIIVDRELEGNSPVSALLNISDGLLADCLNVQVICSFNTDLSKIDEALLRKGRLIARYEFTELATPKAHSLSQKLGFCSPVTHPMTLTAIYNQEEKDFMQKEQGKVIGFR